MKRLYRKWIAKKVRAELEDTVKEIIEEQWEESISWAVDRYTNLKR